MPDSGVAAKSYVIGVKFNFPNAGSVVGTQWYLDIETKLSIKNSVFSIT